MIIKGNQPGNELLAPLSVVILGGVTRAQPADFIQLCEHYALEMQPDSVPDLLARFNLRFPGEEIPPGWPTYT